MDSGTKRGTVGNQSRDLVRGGKVSMKLKTVRCGWQLKMMDSGAKMETVGK